MLLKEKNFDFMICRIMKKYRIELGGDEKEKLKLEKVKLFPKIASELIKYRIDNNMSQSDLAKKLGVTQNQVSKWESGMNNFKVGTFVEISKKLGLKLKVSLGVVEEKKWMSKSEQDLKAENSSLMVKVEVAKMQV